MKTITYNLNLENNEDYYLKIKKFTSNILKDANLLLNDLIHDFQRFLIENQPTNLYINENFEKNYNFDEHVFELLFIGIMWKNYIGIAIKLDPFYQKILEELVDLRNQKDLIDFEEEKSSTLKEKIDNIRGLLATKHLINFNENEQDFVYDKNKKNKFSIDFNDSNEEYNKDFFTIDFNDSNGKYNKSFNIKNLNYLLSYLKATGDYEESLKHLIAWKNFFSRKSNKEFDYYFQNILSFTNTFEKIADKELKEYMMNVNDFRKNQLKKHINKEDIIFCGRAKSEYYLNMFGAEIMNRVFKYEFDKRDKIAIILPICMSLKNNYNDFNKNNEENGNLNHRCKAIEEDLGLKCISCSKKCNISKINTIFKQENNINNIDIYVSSHNSAILSNITEKDKDELAIIGIACINNLIEGGWKISSYGIPAQCVILDYVGCKKHWDDEGFPTNFNIKELERIIGI